MSYLLNNAALDALFRKARTHNAWLDKPVSDHLLRRLYDLMKWGPTSANCCPARILFLRTPEAKQRLAPALAPGNLEKTMKAPVTAIIAHDAKFYEQLRCISRCFLPPCAGKEKGTKAYRAVENADYQTQANAFRSLVNEKK